MCIRDSPYLAQAALLAAGIQGIEDGLTLSPPETGDLYNDDSVPEVPTNLRAATETLRGSTVMKNAMGNDVIDHYVRAAEWEQEALDNAVTQWEIARGFERA